MNIIYHETTKTFHLSNNDISYCILIAENGHPLQLYFGKKIRDREDFSYLNERAIRAASPWISEDYPGFSLEHTRQEYPAYGTTDFRSPAFEVLQADGSRISNFSYISHTITEGKPALPGLPSTYTESPEEAMTLTIHLKDEVTGLVLSLNYTIFAEGGIIARNAKFENSGKETVTLTNAASLSLDLPDSDYEWLQFSGSWARERHLKTRKLEQGIQSIGSRRGHSSSQQNPFIILKRPHTDENMGEAIGFSLVYSGNFLMQAEVDTYDTTRIYAGIHPDGFGWTLKTGESFQTPEAVMAYSSEGLNHLSQTFHTLYQTRLARGFWRDRPRPILLNNWEATYFDFDEKRLLAIASQAKELGVELFVLDDGWFGKRNNDLAGLGDWYVNTAKLESGISGLSDKIHQMGLMFGLWIEPEMVNKDSDLYRAHPDWILAAPNREASVSRHQHVLDFSRKEVVDAIYEMLVNVLDNAQIDYIKWDMNRSITECYSNGYPASQQGEIFHRYILGVYELYERLIARFPKILFESCASGGARFDPGMLYYAPQAWTSDDTDAAERLKIQYGTTFCYPPSSMGCHVSAVPNHQLNRVTPLSTRGNAAFFGAFGYELDLNLLSEDEKQQVREQIDFVKQYREILQYGTFYRLQSPFEDNVCAWMAVSRDKKTAIMAWFKVLNTINAPFARIRLDGLDKDTPYLCNQDGRIHYGDELMYLGQITTDSTSGEHSMEQMDTHDFNSKIFLFTAVHE